MEYSSYNKSIALILCVFGGYFGLHKFYVKKSGEGLIYLFTFGLFGIGWIIDIFMILDNNFKDAYKRPLVDNAYKIRCNKIQKTKPNESVTNSISYFDLAKVETIDKPEEQTIHPETQRERLRRLGIISEEEFISNSISIRDKR